MAGQKGTPCPIIVKPRADVRLRMQSSNCFNRPKKGQKHIFWWLRFVEWADAFQERLPIF